MSEEKEKLIKSIGYNQHQLINDMLYMHNDNKGIDVDITYSSGKFYGTFKQSNGEEFTIEQPKHCFDIEPQFDYVKKLEPWGQIPLEDNSVDSIMIDLPFVCSPKDCKSIKENKKGSNIIFKRFASYYPIGELYASYSHWLSEAFRVLKDGGKCFFKCQNTISGSKYYCTEEYSWLAAQEMGFYVLDRFTLLAKARLISGKIKKQQHARNFSSVFWVFEKNGKFKPIEYNELKDNYIKKHLENGE